MTAKSCLVAITLLSFSLECAASGSSSIGTVSARGDVRIDGYVVQSNGTLFDGTSVETNHATATLRLENGTEITMATNSQGVVHRDRLELLQGESQLKTNSSTFLLEADGLRIAPSGPNTVGTVSLDASKTVNVTALTGELLIVDDSGSPVMHIAPGAPMSFGQATPAGAPYGTSVTETGLVTEENGQYFLTTVGSMATNTKYLLVGKDFHKVVNDKVIVDGKLQPSPTQKAFAEIDVKEMRLNGAALFCSFPTGFAWCAAAVAAAGTGLGVGIYEATKPGASP